MLKIYIENSVVSFLVARPSKDLQKSAWQSATQQWWGSQLKQTEAYISPYVLEEARQGDPQVAQKRLNALKDVPVLDVNHEIADLADFLLLGGGLPAKAHLDALHIACAAYHQLDILLTWNCTHIANPTTMPIMRGLCAAKGYILPELVTPLAMLTENMP